MGKFVTDRITARQARLLQQYVVPCRWMLPDPGPRLPEPDPLQPLASTLM